MADELTIGGWIADIKRSVAQFTGYLHLHGFSAGVVETRSAIEVVTRLRTPDWQETMIQWRIIYAKAPQQWEIFETLFDRYFQIGGARFHMKEAVLRPTSSSMTGPVVNPFVPTADPHYRALLAYSPQWGKDYPLYPSSEVNYGSLRESTRKVVKEWGYPRGSRWRKNQGSEWYWRKILHDSLSHGGEAITWPRRRHKPDRPRVVALVDVSGSMREYAPFYLGLVWDLMRVGARVQIFVCSTDLKCVTSKLKQTGPGGPPVIEKGELGGGTRLGWAFSQLWHLYRALLTTRTIFVVASDGFDTGEAWRVTQYFPQIANAVSAVYWFNPLLLEPDYTPRSSAILSALPFCRAHVGVRDEASWSQFARTHPG